MKQIFSTICLATLLSTAALAGSAPADLSVTASITSNCTISTTALAFGAYNPITGTAVPGTGTVTTACTTDVTAPYITLGQGAHPAGGSSDATPLRQLSDGATTPNFLTYNIYTTAGGSTVIGNTTGVSGTGVVAPAGTGTPQDKTVYGTIAAGQHTAPAGSYTDTVVATVTF